ncbi:MAG TPA: hypothetical protein VM183_14925 [Burkholderiales bacterium]|nr:hypothetical protein [Burkholderiales bacterium]
MNAKCENLLLFPFFGYIAFPWLALVLWGAYALYEWLMKARILCSGECNIRIDLVLLIPILWIAVIVAVVQFFRKNRTDAVT